MIALRRVWSFDGLPARLLGDGGRLLGRHSAAGAEVEEGADRAADGGHGANSNENVKAGVVGGRAAAEGARRGARSEVPGRNPKILLWEWPPRAAAYKQGRSGLEGHL